MRWLLLFVLAACTDFDTVSRNVCGNGLLEAGEDCDSTDPTCVACAVTCAVDTDCPSDAYACGVDGFCHAPGGELARPTAPVTFRADELRVTDIDHDGTGDVLGVSRTSIVVRYGDAAGALTATASFVTPTQSGPPSFGDLDGDGSLDVTLATADGLVTYTSAFGTLAPVDVELALVENGNQPIDMLAMYPFGALQFIAFGVADGAVIVIVYDFIDPTKAAFAVPCYPRLGAIPRASFAKERVDVYRANAPDAAARSTVLAFTTTTGGACTLAISGSTAGGYTITDISPPGAGTFATRPILADLDTDSDPCPGLVSSDGGPAALKYWDGALASGRCTLASTVTQLPPLQNAPPNAVAIGRLPIDPPIALVASDGLVTTNGIYGLAFGALLPFYQSTRPLSQVAFGDLDGDGDIDAVATSPAEDDLDIFYRYPEGVELLRYDTASSVTSITIGDYDGNGIGDLAYTEAAISHQRLFVAYGTLDRHLAPLQVAAFGRVATLTPFAFRDSADNLSIADDLIVLQPAVGNDTARATILHGSPQRTMLSFLDPRASEHVDQSVMRSTVVGEVAGGDEQDLLVFAAPSPGATIGMRAYRVAGTANGLDTAQTAGTVVDGLADCTQTTAAAGACVENAAFLAWDRAAATDVVIAVDRRSPPRAMRIDPGLPARPIPALVDGLPAGAVVQSLHAYDVDGDGARELVAAFTGSVRICDVDAEGMPTACTDIASALPQATLTCIDAAPGRVGERGVIALCRAGSTASLFRVTRTGDGLAATELARGVGLRALRVADVTGDGVDDVVAVQGDGSASALVVFPQCTSRDVESCRAEGRDK